MHAEAGRSPALNWSLRDHIRRRCHLARSAGTGVAPPLMPMPRAWRRGPGLAGRCSSAALSLKRLVPAAIGKPTIPEIHLEGHLLSPPAVLAIRRPFLFVAPGISGA